MTHFVRRSTRSRNPVREIEYVVTDQDMLDNEFVRCKEQENFPDATGYLWWHAAKECEACEERGVPCYYYAPRLKKNSSSRGHLDRCYRCRKSNIACDAESTAQKHRYLRITNLTGQPNVAPTQPADAVAPRQDNTAHDNEADVEMHASGSGGQNADAQRKWGRKRRRLNHTPPATPDEAELSDVAPHSSSAGPSSPSAHLASPRSLTHGYPVEAEPANVDGNAAAPLPKTSSPRRSLKVTPSGPSLPAVHPPPKLPQSSPADAIGPASRRSSLAYNDSQSSGLDAVLAEINHETDVHAATIPDSPTSALSLETTSSPQSLQSGHSAEIDPDTAPAPLDPEVSGAIEPPTDRLQSPRTPSVVDPGAFRIGSSSLALLGIPSVDVRVASTFDAPMAGDHMHLRAQAGDLVTVLQRNEKHKLVLALHEDGRPGWVPMADLHLEGVDMSALPEAPNLIVAMNDDLTREVHVRLENWRQRKMKEERNRPEDHADVRSILKEREAQLARLQGEAETASRQAKVLRDNLEREQAVSSAHMRRINILQRDNAEKDKALSAAQEAARTIDTQLAAKRDKLRQVETKLKEVEAAKDGVLRQLEARNGKWEEQGLRLASRNRHIDVVEGELKSMKVELEAQVAELATVRGQLATKDKEIASIIRQSATQLEQAGKAEDDAVGQLKTATTKLAQQTRKVSVLEGKIGSLEEALKAERAAAKAVSLRLQATTTELVQKVQQLDDKDSRIGVLEGKFKAEQAAKDEISAQLDATKTELAGKNRQIGDLEGKLEAEQAAKNYISIQLDVTEAALARKNSQIGDLESKLKAERAAKDGISAQLRTSTTQLTHQSKKVGLLEHQVKMAREAERTMIQQVKDRNAELAQRSGKIDDLNGKFKATQRELEASKCTLATRVREHGVAVKEAHLQRDEAKRQLAEKTEELARVELQLPESALPAIIAERDKAHRLVGVANAERDGALAERDKAHVEKEGLVKERDKAVKAIGEAQQTIAVLEKQLAETRETEKLRAAVQDLQAEIVQLRQINEDWHQWHLEQSGNGVAQALVELSNSAGSHRPPETETEAAVADAEAQPTPT